MDGAAKGQSDCRLEIARFLWEIPNMKTAIVDDKNRIRIPDLKPGEIFAYELSGGGVKLTPLKPVANEIPVVNPVKQKDGSYHWPVDLTREEITAAIRADRNEQ